MNHEGKCKHLHGHRYIVELYVTAPALDSLGRIIDFSVLKEVVGRWIDDELDHKTMLCDMDQSLITCLRDAGFANSLAIVPFNPTAENIAAFIFKKTVALLATNDIKVTRVIVHETPNCSAEYRDDHDANAPSE